MSWIKDNKFLFGFFLFVAAGVAVLGYLLLGASSAAADAQASFQSKASELSGLQRMPVFPSQKNLDKLLEQKKEVESQVSKLTEELASQQIPAEPMTPYEFQDRLKSAVAGTTAKASQATPPTTLGDKAGDRFFLGFNRYEAAPPSPGATVPLGRELKAIDWLVNTMIDTRVKQITTLTRSELPEETASAASPKPQDRSEPRPSRGKLDAAPKPEIKMHPVVFEFVCSQATLKTLLNKIQAYSGQMFVIRQITVANEKTVAPARVATVPTGSIAAEATPAPTGGAAGETASRYIVGEESIRVGLMVDIVDIVPAPAIAAK